MKKIFTPESFLKGIALNRLPAATQENLLYLASKCNLLEIAFEHDLTITSGYRSPEDQYRIYREKGVTDTSKVPMGSSHLKGLACDFADTHGLLDLFLSRNNGEMLVKLGLYLEHPDSTPGWTHIQLNAPKSGKRIFYP